jgi:hypothetical protein
LDAIVPTALAQAWCRLLFSRDKPVFGSALTRRIDPAASVNAQFFVMNDLVNVRCRNRKRVFCD